MPYFGGEKVPVCPSSSSPAPVGAGTLRACWWWEMWVPPPGTGCSPSQRRGAMGDPLPCCAEDLLGGGPILPHCPASAPFPPNLCPSSTKRFSGPFPLCSLTGEGDGVSSCCFPLPLGGLDHSIQTLPAGRLAALGPYLPRLQDPLTLCHPPKKAGSLSWPWCIGLLPYP